MSLNARAAGILAVALALAACSAGLTPSAGSPASASATPTATPAPPASPSTPAPTPTRFYGLLRLLGGDGIRSDLLELEAGDYAFSWYSDRPPGDDTCTLLVQLDDPATREHWDIGSSYTDANPDPGGEATISELHAAAYYVTAETTCAWSIAINQLEP